MSHCLFNIPHAHGEGRGPQIKFSKHPVRTAVINVRVQVPRSQGLALDNRHQFKPPGGIIFGFKSGKISREIMSHCIFRKGFHGGFRHSSAPFCVREFFCPVFPLPGQKSITGGGFQGCQRVFPGFQGKLLSLASGAGFTHHPVAFRAVPFGGILILADNIVPM